MDLLQLSYKQINRRSFRSGLVILFVSLVVFSAIWMSLSIQAVQDNLGESIEGMQHLNADIVVIRMGSGYVYAQPDNVELIHILNKVSMVPGVDAVAQQLRLFTYQNSPYSSASEVYIYTFNPETDFTVLPWISPSPVSKLGYSEAYAGSAISIHPSNQTIALPGMDIRVVAYLAPTGTNLDQSVFVSPITAKNLAERFRNTKDQVMGLEANYVPVFMVKLLAGANSQNVKDQILRDVQGVTAFDSAQFFRVGRDQMTNLLDNLKYTFTLIWSLSIVGIGIVFAISINERRRELGVLRVLGSTRMLLLGSIMREGMLLAIFGGLLGILLSSIAVTFFTEEISQIIQIPINVPSLLTYLVMAGLSLLIALFSVTLASLYPAWVVARQDPAVAFRG